MDRAQRLKIGLKHFSQTRKKKKTLVWVALVFFIFRA